MFRRVPGTYRVTGKEFQAPPAKIWALWAKRENAPAIRGWCAPPIAGRPKEEREKGEGKENVD